MRKIYSIIMILITAIVLVGCLDRKLDDTYISVYFYTGSNATNIGSYDGVEVGTTIPEPEEPVRPKFFFLGWYRDLEFTQPWDFENDVVEETMVLYARWQSEAWQVTFVLNEELGEYFDNPATVPSEFTADVNLYLPVVKRPGGQFKGWILVPPSEYTLDMTIYRYSNDLPTQGRTEFTLYPVFNNNKYLVTFNPRMAGVPTPAPKTGVEYGSIINWVPVINDTATHTFVGWYTKNGSTTGDWGIKIEDGDYWILTSNALLYGRWEEK
jgi:hypothetical protein